MEPNGLVLALMPIVMVAVFVLTTIAIWRDWHHGLTVTIGACALFVFAPLSFFSLSALMVSIVVMLALWTVVYKVMHRDWIHIDWS